MASAKILIVEDEILIARRIESTLNQLGYVVAGIALDAQSALHQTAETHPDLVLMDIVLQDGYDGVVTAGQIRDRFQIPVVYLTAYADSQTLERAKTTHPLGYILKPFSRTELRVAIELALSRHQTSYQAAAVPLNSPLQADHFAMLSQELRSSLSVIKLSMALLNDHRHQLDESAKCLYFQQVESTIDTMDQLLQNIHTLRQAEIDLLSVMPEHLDVVNFCQELIESLQWSVGDQYNLFFSSKADVLYANLDSKWLWHLLINLLSNAIKYSASGSSIMLLLYQRSHSVCFEIRDQGIGIPAAEHQRVFHLFSRGSNVGNIPGTGLGLTIAKRVAELHGGQIAIDSQIGQGTTVTVTLPL